MGARHRRAATITITGALVGVLVLLAGACDDDDDDDDDGAAGPTTASIPAEDFDVAAAREYCTSKGGEAEVRQAYWGTNLEQSSWSALPETMEVCRFEADDESRIYLDLETLYADEPTLAAAAYLAKLPLPATTGGANPAAVGCADTLHGTSSWGTGVSGGGWVNTNDPVFTVVDMCMFSDRSAIDQWGIAYYSDGVVRGTDLSKLFRFDVDDVPAFFTPPSTAG